MVSGTSMESVSSADFSEDLLIEVSKAALVAEVGAEKVLGYGAGTGRAELGPDFA